jgi:hypothetical protein
MNISETGCWLSEDLVKSHHFDEGLAKAMAHELIGMGRGVDIGCGSGAYVKFLNDEYGIWVDGYDGSPLTEDVTNGLCRQADFSEPQDVGKYDFVISLEVGEHIPAEYEKTFLNNLVMPTPDMIILSWAVEGQAGQGHVNCRSNKYIISEMEDRGYAYDKKASLKLRLASRLPWFKNTIMVFELTD